MILVALLLICCPRPGLASAREYTVKEVAPRTFVWIPEDVVDQSGDPSFSRAANAGFVVTDEGVVVIDTTNSPLHARELLFEIRQRTSIPVRLVIDMGPQGDQILGNEVFAEQRAAIVSTASAASRMRLYQEEIARHIAFDPILSARMRGIHFTLPDKTFDGVTSFAMSGLQVQLVTLNCSLPGKAEGNAAVFFPQARVAFLGDLYVNGYIPRADSLDVRRWIAVLGEVEKWNASVYVPAHGAPGSKEDLERFKGFLEWLQGRVQGGIQEGKSLTQMERELLDTQALYLRAPELAPSTIAAVYRQLMDSRSGRHTRSIAAPPVPAESRRGVPPLSTLTSRQSAVASH